MLGRGVRDMARDNSIREDWQQKYDQGAEGDPRRGRYSAPCVSRGGRGQWPSEKKQWMTCGWHTGRLAVVGKAGGGHRRHSEQLLQKCQGKNQITLLGASSWIVEMRFRDDTYSESEENGLAGQVLPPPPPHFTEEKAKMQSNSVKGLSSQKERWLVPRLPKSPPGRPPHSQATHLHSGHCPGPVLAPASRLSGPLTCLAGSATAEVGCQQEGDLSRPGQRLSSPH